MAMDINGLNSNQTNANRTRAGDKVSAPKNSQVDSASTSESGSSKDTVSISAEGKKLSQLSGQLGADTPVNREKVDALRAAVSDGTYKVDTQSLAKKILADDSLF